MTNIEPAAMPQLPTPGRVGQGTAVEQSRAVAEVHAAILVAQQCPRDVQAALAAMTQSCEQSALAERAFYRFPRGGKTVSGSTVHLARELARCWGNVQYGIVEMRRDDEYGQSEMQAFAWDVQTNSRVSSTFIVPHKRDQQGGPKQLVDMRDIYENNANNGARRLREAIFSILPPWLKVQAEDLCNKTLKDGGGVPLPQRIATAVQTYDKEGVSVDQLETKLGRPRNKWTDHDVAQLRIIARSIAAGEVTKDEEFPPPRVTSEEITGRPAPASPPPAAETETEAATRAAAEASWGQGGSDD